MSWQRVFNNPVDEQAQFKRAVKRAQKLLKELAQGDDDWKKVDRAISRAEYLARYVEEEAREEAYSLRRGFGAAIEAGREARSRMWEEESRKLREKIREAQPTGFEKELALLKGRR